MSTSKRTCAYNRLKGESRTARICIAAVFAAVLMGVLFINTPLTRSLKEGMLGAFSYDMQLFDAGKKAQELFAGQKDQSVSGGAEVLKSFKKPLKNPSMTGKFSENGKSVFLQAGQLLSVYAVADGTVINIDREVIQIRHEDGVVSTYTGCKSKYVKMGDKITAGSMIGALDPEKSVLEFSLQSGEKYIDPETYIDMNGW